jgi:hypothetical protein
MRNLYELDAYRIRGEAALDAYGWEGDDVQGWFVAPSPIDRQPLVIVASATEGWDHVSVSRKNRCPNWQEMEHIAKLFFKDDETAMQLHVPEDQHVNFHPHCLHWWRPMDREIPQPPAIFVGLPGPTPRNQAEALARMKAAGLR